jgi:LmbE family N-acetylglucosaminyl deacetylase
VQESPLTLLAVHAHPDDETITMGGVLARYAAEGIRTVLICATGGERGAPPDTLGLASRPHASLPRCVDVV